MSQENGPAPARRKRSPFATLIDWPLVRKLESLVFLAMFLAMPLFAFRVIDYSARQLALQNGAHDVVKDIRRAREMAIQMKFDVTVEGRKSQYGKPSSYVIRNQNRVLEEIILAKGVTIIGEVTFQPDGKPKSPAIFEVHSETRSLIVDVDAQGGVSVT
ncbi:MAG: hypothetical protein JSS83_22525 [Cyanobacteria bacterium SZAS LIN-3]|nr:hypothetical protein [Cyanobacteria bacterium SZAS LIN-3]MBS2006813.1 hypothetical protein [Cyanobacteria bacterium SZAS TMP-1]